MFCTLKDPFRTDDRMAQLMLEIRSGSRGHHTEAEEYVTGQRLDSREARAGCMQVVCPMRTGQATNELRGSVYEVAGWGYQLETRAGGGGRRASSQTRSRAAVTHRT